MKTIDVESTDNIGFCEITNRMIDMRTGLVLEGGAMRGMYTAGVLDVFMEQNVEVELVVGVSAGALFGVNYLSGQIGRVIRYNKKYNSDKNYMGIRPFLKEGNLVSTEYAYEKVPHYLDPFDNEKFLHSKKRFYAVTTNVRTGEAEYMLVKDVFRQMDVLRASGSMPFVSTPVKIGGQKYLDGGISDSIPFHWMARQGVDKQIVILTQDISYRKSPMSPILTRLYGLIHPAVSRCLAKRHIHYNEAVDSLRKWEEEGKVFVIRPSVPLNIKKTERDPKELQRVYDIGRQDAKKALPVLKEYLAS